MFFILIPLLLLVFIPFFIAVKREHLTRGTLTALILHVIIALSITVVATGASATTVITETRVIVLADVSHSATKNLDTIDGYINEIKENMPKNSKMGVVAFGKDQKTVTEPGQKFTTVHSSGADDSGTDIGAALNYAAEMLDGDFVKHIILITDAKQTSGDGISGVIGTIDRLYLDGIYIDAIYIDSNAKEDECEVQLSSVDFTPATFLNHESVASVLIQSSFDGNIPATVRLFKDSELIATEYPVLTRGFNVVNFTMPTDTEGVFDYRITAEVDASGGNTDLSDENNSLSFVQAVSSNVKTLLLTDDEADVETAMALYGKDAEITAYLLDDTLVIRPQMSKSEKEAINRRISELKSKYENTTVKLFLNDSTIPCTTEELVIFDEFIISDVDIRRFDSALSYVTSITKLVSDYGKSLMTFGNTYIQNQTDTELLLLDSILPVNYGNSGEEKLVCLVIDTSRSMELQDKLTMARAAAKQLVGLLGDNDRLIIINFFGDYTTVLPETPVGGFRDNINYIIDTMQPQQGTLLAKGMREAYDKVILSNKEDKQIFLMSDGRTWANEEDDAVEIARELYELGIPTSVLNTCTKETLGDEEASGKALKLLQDIAKAGSGITDDADEGNYYYIEEPDDLEALILSDVIDDINDTVIEGKLPVNIKIQSDKVLLGIMNALPDVNGYYYSNIKSSATTVLSSDYTTKKGGIKEVPLYAYWKYGDGKIASFTSTLSGKWVSEYTAGEGARLFSNIINTLLPSERHTAPFRVFTDTDGGEKVITLIPDVLSFDGEATISVTYPNGKTEINSMTFNSKSYSASFGAFDSGKYEVKLTYKSGKGEYTEVFYLNVPYSPEYDSFTTFTVSDLYKMVRSRGEVHTNADFSLENREEDIATYTMYFTAPLMILAVLLFVLDVAFRKLRLKDITNLFGEKVKRGGKEK